MKIAFLGDIALIGKYDLTQNQSAKDRLIWFADKLKSYDYVVANLETPLTDKTSSLIPKSMHLRSPKVNVEILKFLGVNAVSLANNHIYDFGINAFKETIEILDENNIKWFGANNKKLEIEFESQKVNFHAYCCYSTNGFGYIKTYGKTGIHPLRVENIYEELKKDRLNNVFSVVSLHWGTEHTNYPNIENIKLASQMVCLNSCIIHGHHPHMVHPVKMTEGSIIAYSLGNCIFDDCESINGSFYLKQNDENRKSYILEVELNNNKIEQYKTTGFADTESGIEMYVIEKELNQYANIVDNISDIETYNKLRRAQIQKIAVDKFGKRNFKWLLSRLNYYSAGARVFSKLRKYQYNRYFKNRING